MCVYIAIILQVMLWFVDSAPALKYHGYRLQSWLAGHLEKGSVHWRVRPGTLCVLWEGVYSVEMNIGSATFLIDY